MRYGMYLCTLTVARLISLQFLTASSRIRHSDSNFDPMPLPLHVDSDLVNWMINGEDSGAGARPFYISCADGSGGAMQPARHKVFHQFPYGA
jgi:hypothetical protein